MTSAPVTSRKNDCIIPTKRRKLPKRKVRFTEENVVRSNASLRNHLTTEDIHTLWYTKSEQKIFKRNVVRLLMIHAFRKDLRLSCPRGIEAYSKQRMIHRKSTIRSIVGAHKLGYESEWIASLSRQKTHWNKELAETQGCLDFIEVLLEQKRP